MSKDLAIAGVMVLSCLVVSAIAFVPPAAKDTKNPPPAIASNRKPIEVAPRPVQPAQPVQPSPIETPRPAGLEPITPLPFDNPPKPPTSSFPPPQPGPA